MTEQEQVVRFRAKDEVSGALSSIGEKLHHLNREARSGAFHGFETLLKGAGAAAFVHFGAEAIGKAAEATREWAEGTLSVGQAWLKASEGVPIIGAFVGAIKEGVGALDAMREKMDGAFEEAKHRQQYLKTKGEVEGGAQRFDSAMAGLGGKAAEIGMDEPEKMRLHARQEWIKTGDEIEKLTREADLLARKQLSLYWGAFRDGPGKEDRQREYALVSAQLERERDQIKRMEEFRAAIRSDANQKAADVETQIVAKFYGDLASAAQGAMEKTARAGFDMMQQIGARMVDAKADQDRKKADFMRQNWLDTREWEQLQQESRDEWENQQDAMKRTHGLGPAPFAPAVQTGPRFTGVGLGGNTYAAGQDAQVQVGNKVDKSNEHLRDIAEGIRDMREQLRRMDTAQLVQIF